MGSQGWGGAEVWLVCVARSDCGAGKWARRSGQAQRGEELGGRRRQGSWLEEGPRASSVGLKGREMQARWCVGVLRALGRARDVAMAGSAVQDEIAQGSSRGGADLACWEVGGGRFWKISG